MSQPMPRTRPMSHVVRVAMALLGVGLLGAAGHACNRTSRKSVKQQTPPPSSEAALYDRLQTALRAKGPGYIPRTRHKRPDGTPKYANRLILESSPYLLQHAHNPVNWFAWGPEAFERARALRRPIFLSIGYSTCHWCHVMEEESFEDEEIARYLNDHYVAIKIDREERPDVDSVYMTFVQSLTGTGGWPMSVWLTPAREPFFGGTYFPPRAGVRGARTGFLDVLAAQSRRFMADPAAVVTEARSMIGKLQTATAPEPAGDFPSASLLAQARAEAAQRFDPVAGGNQGAPKFPSTFPSRLLLRIARRAGDAGAGRMATETLDHMRSGGIFDQVGGGFHRYATDARWLVPHFEKMLYDNADLALAYLEAAQATGDARYTSTLRETLDYLLRDMRSPDATFYSATDADSPNADGRREEGVFFTWTPAELGATLGSDDARVASAWFGVTDAGHVDGRSVLHVDRSLAAVAREIGLGPAALEERLGIVRSRLLARRSTRPPPLRDEKVIVAWNGLAVSAFARAAIAMGDARYADAAVRAASALVVPFRQGSGLPHVYVGGRPSGRGFSDDHVFLAAALLDVFELTADPTWLADSESLMEEVERSFADPTHGGYYLTAAHHERLFLRDKPDADGPTPSVNSIAALTWLRLFVMTGDGRFRQRAETTLRAFSRTLASRPLALERMLLAVDFAIDAVKEIAVVVPEGRGAVCPGARALLDVLARRFVPNAVLVVGTEADFAVGGELGRRIPWARDKKLQAGRTTAYVCERGTCKLPTGTPAVFAKQLAEARPYP